MLEETKTASKGTNALDHIRMSAMKITKQGDMVESDRGTNICDGQERDSCKINMYLNKKKEPRGYLEEELPRKKNSKCKGPEVLTSKTKHRSTRSYMKTLAPGMLH